ncbi:MAG: prepilin-type N-terminal cleavage/methylation domain-containing protein [Acidobacteria bacterium]|nr:prepilin-type N-terminal cleavage/methylation domain-containing protein [Acidobacteriota bacterium]
MEHHLIKQDFFKTEIKTETGFSLVELLIVFTIISIMSGAALFFLAGNKKLYQADDEALKIVDIMQEARQRSLTQRETMRVEIDLTSNMVRLIDENTVTTANDDTVVRSVALADQGSVSVSTRPSEITDNPPEPFPVPTMQFKLSSYPTSNAHNVATIRFQSNGMIVDAGNNPTGAGAISVGATVHVWSKKDAESDSLLVARAITVIGSTGSVRLWEYNPGLQGNSKWQDSRRTGSYGGQQTGNPTPTP